MWSIIIGVLAQAIDTIFGVGFGTIMTPILLSLDYPVYETITTLLLIQGIAGLLGATLYYLQGTIDWGKKKNFKPTLMMILLGIAGAITGSLITINLELIVFEVIIALIVIGSGFLFFFKQSSISEKKSIKKLFGFTFLGSVTKVMSGVYGPIITPGQLLSGYNPKKSVAKTVLTEGIISLVGFIILFSYSSINFSLFWPLLIIVLITIPISVYLVRFVPKKRFKKIIGVVIIMIGFALIIKLFGKL